MKDEPQRDRADEESLNTGECLVPDLRPQLRPAQLVEEKLLKLLKKAPLPVSCMQTAQRLRPR
jgi:hypothetical protein